MVEVILLIMLCAWLLRFPAETLHRHLPHTEQEVEIRAGGGGNKKKILTSSYPEGCRLTTHPVCLACVQMYAVASVCVPFFFLISFFYAGFGLALTLHRFNNEGVVKVWQ